MTDSNQYDDEGSAQDSSANTSDPPDSAATEKAEEALELDDLERLGVDGVLAQIRGGDPAADSSPDEFEVPRRRRARSPWINVVVLGLSAFLLVSMFPDFRYWLRDDAPEQLGHVSNWLVDGRVPPGFENRYVTLEGTPDAQNAALLTTKEGFVRYDRILEAQGQLFVATPRQQKAAPRVIAGKFEGKLVRLGDDRAFGWLDQYYFQEEIIRSVDATPQALAEALASDASEGATVESSEGPIEMAAGDRVVVVVRRPEARVQLDAKVFRTAKSADEAVAGLGYPYFRRKDGPKKIRSIVQFWDFAVRIPPAQWAQAAAKLSTAAPGQSQRDPKDPPAVVLPMTATFTVPIGVATVEGQSVRFPYGDNTTNPGYELDSTKTTLVGRGLADGMVEARLEDLAAVRLQQAIKLEPDGYLIEVAEAPSKAWKMGVLWLVVLGISLANLAGLVVARRRRRSGTAAA